MRILAALLLALSLLSVAVSVLALRRSGGDDAGARRALAEDTSRLGKRAGELEAAVRALAGRVDSLEARPDGTGSAADPEPGRDGARPESDHSAALDDLAGQVGELKARLLEFEEKANRPQVVLPASGQPPETEEARRQVVAVNQPIAIDPARSTRERLEALRNLRFRDGRSREVTQAMIELIQDPGLDPRTRADIIRNLHGVDFPELKPVLLQVLASDTHVETRSETVETLEPYYGDPAVRGAVTRVGESDPDLRVRAEALRRLGQYDAAMAGKEQ
jgi:hypothetical protein